MDRHPGPRPSHGLRGPPLCGIWTDHAIRRRGRVSQRSCLGRDRRVPKGWAMKWVTRENANVDRIACPWLIKRFVDPDAEFFYVPRDEVNSVAERWNAIPYDVPDVELGHVDGRCSFESILLKYNLTGDAGLMELA